MRFQGKLKFAALILLLVVIGAFVASCGGSRANSQKRRDSRSKSTSRG